MSDDVVTLRRACSMSVGRRTRGDWKRHHVCVTGFSFETVRALALQIWAFSWSSAYIVRQLFVEYENVDIHKKENEIVRLF